VLAGLAGLRSCLGFGVQSRPTSLELDTPCTFVWTGLTPWCAHEAMRMCGWTSSRPTISPLASFPSDGFVSNHHMVRSSIQAPDSSQQDALNNGRRSLQPRRPYLLPLYCPPYTTNCLTWRMMHFTDLYYLFHLYYNGPQLNLGLTAVSEQE